MSISVTSISVTSISTTYLCVAFLFVASLFLSPLGCASDSNRSGNNNGTGDGSQKDASVEKEGATTDGYVPTDGLPADRNLSDGWVSDGDLLVDAVVVDGGPQPLPYPTRTAYRIKALQPDFWGDKNEISGNNTGGVAMNLVWANWEPTPKSPPCDPTSEQEYDGQCYVIDTPVDDAIREWTSRGLVVTAVVYGVPEWARQNINCTPISAGFEIFCAPDDPTQYGRFVGMLAHRYNGLFGNGRLADFVIHNEVNTNDWFDIGCGQGTPCDPEAWMDEYAENYISAYDAVMEEQPFAKILASFTHHFASSFDDPSATNPVLSVQTFLQGLHDRVNGRQWRVAYHPYPPNLLSPVFSPDDLPRVTYGNLGVLVGWLRATFPNTPSAWTIQLTESGINSLSPNSSQAAQANAVCDTFRNVLGTPGIENYIYHRMKDHPAEVSAGLGLGLRDTNGDAKQAWAVWALANRNDLDPPQLSCGFEHLPYTRLTRSHHSTRGHWASTRVPPDGFSKEGSWYLYREEQNDTTLLYECAVGQHNMISPDVHCEGQTSLGPVGYILNTHIAGSIALYRCRIGSGQDHFISTASNCEEQNFDQLLGYAIE